MFRHSAAFALCVSVTMMLFGACAQDDAAPEPDAAESAEADVDYKTVESPVPFTEASIKRGRSHYMRYCTSCHGPDGKAQIDIIADATDLTTPQFWKHGSTPGETFKSIRDGAGVAMPPFSAQIRREEDIWHITNFVMSLWPQDKRPELQQNAEEPEDGAESDDAPAEEGGTAP